MDQLIKKRVIYAGSSFVPLVNGTKVKFHYKTVKCDEAQTVLDDSKQSGQPMELILGKKFKLEAWELAVKTMALNEIASFTVDKKMTTPYPLVAKTLRDVQKPATEASHKSHCCASGLYNNGVGYDDLNNLLQSPCDLEFILELIKIEKFEDYDKESWQLNDDQKIKAVPELQNEGNMLYRNKEYQKAAEKYKVALCYLEQLMLKEKPRDEEWNTLNTTKMPILLNFAQCNLLDNNFYGAIEHCTTVLESDANNVKALFRRGKAHVGAWNVSEAECDFRRVVELDPTLKKLVQRELHELDQLKRAKDSEDRTRLAGKMF